MAIKTFGKPVSAKVYKKWATGTVNTASFDIVGLKFKPSMVYWYQYNAYSSTYQFIGMAFRDPSISYSTLYKQATGYNGAGTYAGSIDNNPIFNDNGVTNLKGKVNIPLRWFAFE